MASNDDIADDFTAHQIGLIALAGGLRNRIIALLERVEPDLRALIERRLSVIARNGGIDRGPATTTRLVRLERSMRRLLGPSFDSINEETRDTLLALALHETGFSQAVVAGALPVSVEFGQPTAIALRATVLSRPFQGRILRTWLSDFEANDRRRMMNAVRFGLVQGETPTQISRRIFGTSTLFDGTRTITRRGAQTLAQTAVTAIASNARREWLLANADVFSEEVYTATLDSRTTAICRSLDGRRFPVGEGPYPPLHMNCRSIRVPVVDGEVIGSRPAVGVAKSDLEGLRGKARRDKVASLVGQVPAKTTYAEFLKRQSVAFQNEALGVTKGKLFRDGGLTLDRYVDRAGMELTLPQLKVREADAFRKAGLNPDDF